MPGTALDRCDLGTRHQFEHGLRLHADILHAQVARYLVRDLAQRRREAGLQPPVPVAAVQVIEGIEERRGHFLYVRVVREQKRQLLLEHEHTRRLQRDDIVAALDPVQQLRNVRFLGRCDGLEVAELELRHPAAALGARDRDLDVVVLEHRRQILAHLRRVTVAVAGRIQNDPALRAVRRHRLAAAACAPRQPLVRGFAVVSRHRRIARHAEGLLQNHTARATAVGGINDLGDDRNPRQPADRVGARQHALLQRRAAVAEALRLGAQHQVRKVDVPLVRRHIRALRHVAHVAQVAVIDDVPVDVLWYRVEFAGVGLVDRVEQRGKCVAQVETTPTPVTDVEDALEFGKQRAFVVKRFRPPVDRMAGRGLEAALARLVVAHLNAAVLPPRSAGLPGSETSRNTFRGISAAGSF